MILRDSDFWRHFANEAGDGGGGDSGGDDSGVGPSPGDQYRAQMPPPPDPPPDPPPPDNYDPGPPRRGNRSSRPAPAPPPDPWAGIPGAVRDQANAITDKFLATIGYPQGTDANALALKLAKAGVNITGSPFDAYEWLYQNDLTDAQRQANPWAEFGMGKDDYNQTVSKLNSVLVSWTGDSFTGDNLKTAIRGSWTPDEIRNFAMYGNPEGTGPLLAQAQFTGDDPWLGLGQTYSQTLQGFEAFEGQAPTDKATLAAWFRFGANTKTLGQGGNAAQGPAQHGLQVAGAEVR